jgi:hypothetical protein
MEWLAGVEGWQSQLGAGVEGLTAAWGWSLGAAAITMAALLLGMVLLVLPSVRRRFWCGEAGQEVEVTFDEFGLPGRRSPITVTACSVFSPHGAPRCDRACLDAACRRQWAAANGARRDWRRSSPGS